MAGKGGRDAVSCITDTNDFLVYDIEAMELTKRFSRETITETMQRNLSQECNLIECHNVADGQIALLATSNFNNG